MLVTHQQQKHDNIERESISRPQLQQLTDKTRILREKCVRPEKNNVRVAVIIAHAIIAVLSRQSDEACWLATTYDDTSHPRPLLLKSQKPLCCIAVDVSVRSMKTASWLCGDQLLTAGRSHNPTSYFPPFLTPVVTTEPFLDRTWPLQHVLKEMGWHIEMCYCVMTFGQCHTLSTPALWPNLTTRQLSTDINGTLSMWQQLQCFMMAKCITKRLHNLTASSF